MQKLTKEQAYEKIISDIKLHCRFETIDNFLPIPLDLEIRLAINMAIDDINVYPPRTFINVQGVANAEDVWYTTLLIGACKNVVRTLISDWTANGISASIDSLTLESRLNDYQSLYDRFLTDFNERLERIKKSFGAASRSSITASNSIYGTRVTRSRSILRGGAYHNAGTRGSRYNGNI